MANKKSRLVKTLEDIAGQLIVAGFLVSALYFNFPRKPISFTTKNGDSAVLNFTTLGTLKPYIEVFNKDSVSSIKELFSVEDYDEYLYRDSTGTEYRLTPSKYTFLSKNNLAPFVTRDFVSGDSLSDFLKQKIYEFKGYLSDTTIRRQDNK